MIRTLIVTGGNINKKFLQKTVRENNINYIIASDRGVEILDACNIKPDHIIGDFDSINKEILDKYLNQDNIKIIKLNPEKDFTDTHMALKLAIELKSTNIVILGAIGTRIDHTISNINVLKEALEKNIACEIIDEKNIIKLINKKTILKKDNNFKYISLLPLTTKVEGVTLKGFKYPLEDAVLEIGQSIGVSNEQKEEIATIDLKNGILILLKTKD